MNPDNPTSREGIEAKLTALLLGELSADEAFALGRTIEQDPELAKVYARLKETVGFVRDTVSSEVQASAQSTGLKLSNERREKLLAQFKTVKPREFTQPKTESKYWVLRIAAAGVVIFLIISISIPNFVKTRTTSQSNAILNNLRQIDGAKQQWALENHKSSEDQPTMSDLKPYLKGSAASPVAGETYVVGKVGDVVSAELKTAQGTSQRLALPADGKAESVSEIGRLAFANNSVLSTFTPDGTSVARKKSEIALPSNHSVGEPEWLGVLETPSISTVPYRDEKAKEKSLSDTASKNQPVVAAAARSDSVNFSYAMPGQNSRGASSEAAVQSEFFRGRAAAPKDTLPPVKLEGITTTLGNKTVLSTVTVPETPSVELNLQVPAPAAQPGVDWKGQLNQASNGRGDGGAANNSLAQLAEQESLLRRYPAAEIPANAPLKKISRALVEGDRQIAGKALLAEEKRKSDLLYLQRDLVVPTLGDLPVSGKLFRKETDSAGNVLLGAAISKEKQSESILADVPALEAKKPEQTLAFQNGIGGQTAANLNNRVDAIEGKPKERIGGPQNLGEETRFSLIDDARNREAQTRRAENRAFGFDWYLGNKLAGKSLEPAKKEKTVELAAADLNIGTGKLKQPSSNLYSLNVVGYSTVTNASVAIPNGNLDSFTRPILQFEATPSFAGQATPPEERFKKGEKEIQVAQKKLQDLSSQLQVPNAVANPDSPAVLMSEDTLRKIEVMRDKRKADLERWTTSLELLKRSGRGELVQVLPTLGQDPQMKPLLEGLVVAEQSLVSKTNQFGPENEEIQKLRNQISELNVKINKRAADLETKIALENRSLQNLDEEINRAKKNDAQVAQKHVDELRAKLANDELSESNNSRPAAAAPIPQPEIQVNENPFSTFSLNVSDVSFKLAAASLEKGQMPDPASVRSEEFINAFDYRDPEPAAGVPVAFGFERSRYPFAQNRDLLRFSIKTAAAGRQPGRPLNLVLLLDNSGSMERADRVRIIHEALRVLSGQLQTQDKLSVVTFARTPRLWVDGVPGDQAGKVTEEVSNVTPQGGTNLEEAMNLAYQTAARHYLANGINRVVLLTDGAANLGDVSPESLKQKVEMQRKQGIALDCFGIGWEGFNDDLLEMLSRNGDGRYGFINTPEEAATEFAGQLAGALQVAASDVKVQVEFNPKRVTAYRQIGYARHQLTREQFRDNTVDAAEIGAAESGNALYVIEVNQGGEGPLGIVRVRFKIPGTNDYREHEWPVPFNGNAVSLEQGSPAMRLAAAASAFSEWLVSSPYAGEVTPDALLGYLSGVPDVYGADARPKKLEWMIRQAKSAAGK